MQRKEHSISEKNCRENAARRRLLRGREREVVAELAAITMRRAHEVVVASAAAVLLAAAVVSLRGKRKGASWIAFVRQWRAEESKENSPLQAAGRMAKRAGVSEGVLGAIGNTPLIQIQSLSDATGCEVNTILIWLIVLH
jgi:hypothetical protein